MDNKLFVYGTLMDPKIQDKYIGRIVKGVEVFLCGYEKTEIDIDGAVYPLIILNKDSDVEGQILELTDEELLKVDEYEGTVYKRVNVVVGGGLKAWTYVKA